MSAPCLIEEDEHNVIHIRRGNGECIDCVEGALFWLRKPRIDQGVEVKRR